MFRSLGIVSAIIGLAAIIGCGMGTNKNVTFGTVGASIGAVKPAPDKSPAPPAPTDEKKPN
jgi:hypothetical protein